MKELTEQLKQIQLNILDEFVKICDKHHFRYFALGGTALGSVRHGGFIPWDDDIDVGLSREDFEEFLNVAQAELPSGMFLQTFKTDENYPKCFAKIRVSNTTFIEKTLSNIDINHGVYMDVFPVGRKTGRPVKKVDKGNNPKMYPLQKRGKEIGCIVSKICLS